MSEEQPEVPVVDVSALQAELEAARAEVAKMKEHSDKLLNETKQAKKARDDAAKQAHLEAEEKAKKNGDFEQLLKSSEAERQRLESDLHSYRESISREKTKHEAMRLATELADGPSAELLSEFIARRIKYTDDGVKVVDESGNLTVSSLQDLKREFEGSAKYAALIRGSKASGGSAAGSGSSAPAGAKTMSRSDFVKLSPQAQADFVSHKNGGRLVD